MPDKIELDSDQQHAIEMAVLAKCQPDKVVKEVSAHIPEGAKIAFDMRVTLKGILTRAHGYEVRPTASLLSKAVVARLLRNLGVTREAAKRALLKAVTDAQAAGKDGNVAQNLIEEDRQLLLTLEEVDKDILSRLPKVPRSGAIKVVAATTWTKSKIEPMTPGSF